MVLAIIICVPENVRYECYSTYSNYTNVIVVTGYCCAQWLLFILPYNFYRRFRNQSRSKTFNYAFYSQFDYPFCLSLIHSLPISLSIIVKIFVPHLIIIIKWEIRIINHYLGAGDTTITCAACLAMLYCYMSLWYSWISSCDISYSGGRLNKKDGLTRYGDSHVKDKTS